MAIAIDWWEMLPGVQAALGPTWRQSRGLRHVGETEATIEACRLGRDFCAKQVGVSERE